MIMKNILYLLIILTSASLQAQENLTLEDAITKMMANNHELKSEQMKVKQAEFNAENMFNNRLPTLKLTGRYSKLSEVDPFVVKFNPALPAVELVPSITDQSGIKLVLSQPLFTGFKLESAQSMAEHNNQAGEYDFESRKTENIVRLSQAYFSVLSAEKALAVIQKNLSQLIQRSKDAENMKAQGLLTENDVLKIKVKLSEVEVTAIQAEDNVKLSRMNLNLLLGEKIDQQYKLEIPKESTNSFQRNSRPELLGLEQRIFAQSEYESMAFSDYYPTVFLQIGYDYSNPNQRYFPPKAEWNSSWDVSLILSYDLWTWDTRSNNVEIAKSQINMLEESKIQLTTAHDIEIKSAEMAVERTKKSIAVMENQITQTGLNLRNTENMFNAGLVTTTDVLDAQIQNLQSELQLIQVQLDHQLNQIKLRRANGTLLNWVNQK